MGDAMLDAFIIDRIRRERERERARERAGVPLHIERPSPPKPRSEAPRDDQEDKRGSIVIDFTV